MRIDYPNLKGTVATPISKSTTAVQFDADTEALLSSLLEGQWTYLLLSNDFGEREVVRLYVTLGVRRVLRAQEYTQAAAFQVGDIVEYVYTTEHVETAVPSFTHIVVGALTKEEGGIGYKLPTFDHVGSAETVASGDDIHLGRNNQAYGCCDGAGAGALAIEEPYIYLTSKMYPYFIMEPGLRGEARFIFGNEWMSPIEYLDSLGAVVIEGILFGGALSHTQPVEDAIEGGSTFHEATMWGGAIAHTQPPEAITGALMVFYEALIYGGSIQFEQYVEDALQSSARIIEATLS